MLTCGWNTEKKGKGGVKQEMRTEKRPKTKKIGVRMLGKKYTH